MLSGLERVKKRFFAAELNGNEAVNYGQEQYGRNWRGGSWRGGFEEEEDMVPPTRPMAPTKTVVI